MEDAAFVCDRLSAAVPGLKQRLKKLLAAEEDARRWVAYEEAEAERDKLAAELADIYPAFEQKLADLLPRIAEQAGARSGLSAIGTRLGHPMTCVHRQSGYAQGWAPAYSR